MNAKLCLTFGKYILTNLIRVWTSVSGRGNLWKYQAGRKNETEFRVRSRETVISTETTAATLDEIPREDFLRTISSLNTGQIRIQIFNDGSSLWFC